MPCGQQCHIRAGPQRPLCCAGVSWCSHWPRHEGGGGLPWHRAQGRGRSSCRWLIYCVSRRITIIHPSPLGRTRACKQQAPAPCPSPPPPLSADQAARAWRRARAASLFRPCQAVAEGWLQMAMLLPGPCACTAAQGVHGGASAGWLVAYQSGSAPALPAEAAVAKAHEGCGCRAPRPLLSIVAPPPSPTLMHTCTHARMFVPPLPHRRTQTRSSSGGCWLRWAPARATTTT